MQVAACVTELRVGVTSCYFWRGFYWALPQGRRVACRTATHTGANKFKETNVNSNSPAGENKKTPQQQVGSPGPVYFEEAAFMVQVHIAYVTNKAGDKMR